MTEPRSFLARWSERKRAEARAERPPEAPKDAEAPAATDAPVPVRTDAEPDGPLDLEALPSLEDITGETDIGAFLRRGVPGDLRDAALRRAWASDPTISRFIEMADYDWDFNAPGGNQVFGPLSSAVDAVRMAAEILNPPPRALVETPRTDDPGEAGPTAGPDPVPSETSDVPSVVSTTEDDGLLTSQVTGAADLSETRRQSIFVTRNSSEFLEFEVARPDDHAPQDEAPGARRRRRHGGALPETK